MTNRTKGDDDGLVSLINGCDERIAKGEDKHALRGEISLYLHAAGWPSILYVGLAQLLIECEDPDSALKELDLAVQGKDDAYVVNVARMHRAFCLKTIGGRYREAGDVASATAFRRLALAETESALAGELMSEHMLCCLTYKAELHYHLAEYSSAIEAARTIRAMEPALGPLQRDMQVKMDYLVAQSVVRLIEAEKKPSPKGGDPS